MQGRPPKAFGPSTFLFQASKLSQQGRRFKASRQPQGSTQLPRQGFAEQNNDEGQFPRPSQAFHDLRNEDSNLDELREWVGVLFPHVTSGHCGIGQPQHAERMSPETETLNPYPYTSLRNQAWSQRHARDRGCSLVLKQSLPRPTHRIRNAVKGLGFIGFGVPNRERSYEEWCLFLGCC